MAITAHVKDTARRELLAHYGHAIRISTYEGEEGRVHIDCADCHAILISLDESDSKEPGDDMPSMTMVKERIGETKALGQERCEKLRAAARGNYALHMDDNVEIDDDAQCLEAGDPGYWVEAWVYIRKEDIGEDPDDDSDDDDHEPLSGLEYYESIAPPVGA